MRAEIVLLAADGMNNCATGLGRFDCLVEDCIESAPSRQPNARWYGMRLPGDHPQAQKGMRVPAGDIEGRAHARAASHYLGLDRLAIERCLAFVEFEERCVRRRDSQCIVRQDELFEGRG